MHLIRAGICRLPDTRFFSVKRRLLRWAGVQVEEGVRVVSSTRILCMGELSIGADTWIGHEVLIVGGDTSIEIGPRVDIAPRVTISSGSHVVDVYGERIAGRGYSAPISIGEGTWICTNATILGGTQIGSHSLVAAGAVVRGEFPSYSMIAGVPARVVKVLR